MTHAQKSEIIAVRKFTQKDGLSSYNIRSIVQDKYGFIWVATQDGLSKFDGNSFINYSKTSPEKHKICGTDIRQLAEDTARNLLWLLPGEIGLNAINTITGNVELTIPITYSHPEDWNISMLLEKDRVWIGLSTGVKIYNIKEKKFESAFPFPDPLAKISDFEVRSLFKDKNTNIWVCFSGFGIVVYDSKTLKPLKTIPLSELNDRLGNKKIKFFKEREYSPGCILFATNQGLREIKYSDSYKVIINNSPCQTIPELNEEAIEYIEQKNTGELLIAKHDKLFLFDKTLTTYSLLEEPVKFSETNWLHAVQYTYFDQNANLWLGCQEGLGFISAQKSAFKPITYDQVNNVKLDHVRSILPLLNGDFLVGLRNGIVHIDQKANRFIKTDVQNLYHHIFLGPDNNIIVSRSDGLFIYSGILLKDITSKYPEFASFRGISINSHIQINDSLMILGTENANGILIWNILTHTVRKISDDSIPIVLGSSIVNNIFLDSRDRIWILSDNIITILSSSFQKIKEVTLFDQTNKQLYGLFFDMCEINDGYCIASYGAGIIQLDTNLAIKNVFNTKTGLSNDGVYQVYNLQNDKILVTSNNGVSLLNLKSSVVQKYFEEDGLQSNSFEEVAGLKKDALIYAGGINGFTIIDPTLFSNNSIPPKLYFTNLTIETKSRHIDTSNYALKEFTIPASWLNISLSFSGINYYNPKKTTYWYKISEIHKNWISLNHQNFLTLIGFSPGTYHLQVQTFNEDGIPSEIKELTLIFLPKWYQTWWFKALMGLVLLVIVYSLYRLRINQLKKEEKIRRQLASDLHDDLGSTLNSVKVYANLALMEKENTSYLQKIKESTQEAIGGVRDLIWVLDDKKDTPPDLLARIQQFAAPICDANHIAFIPVIDTALSNYKLGKEEKRNLYMILKESINNSIKYAGCKKIEVTISSIQGKPNIKITDDGKGFETATAREGNGLKNIRNRAKGIHYEVAIRSSAGQGTSIHLQKT